MNDPGGYVGMRVGARYRLEEMVGGGAMGTVWRATDELLKREVAVKEIVASPGATEEQVARQRSRALREGRIAARVTNVHAIAMYDVVMEADEPWLVMEYLPSTNLGILIAAELVLPVAQVAQIGTQVADAMVDVHAAGILHRDIKPANVLVGRGGDGDGVVKISDFGISHLDGDASLSEAGTLTGTPAYFAPEVARGAPSTAASDVFSLGATLFTCLEGVPPFGRDDDHYLMLRRVAAGVTNPLTRAGAAEPVLSSMLAADPAARPTMTQVRDELAEVAAGRRAALPEVLAARTRLDPLTRVAAGLGAVAAIGSALAGASSLVSGGAPGTSSGTAGAGTATAVGGPAAGPGVAGAVGAGPVGSATGSSGAATSVLATSTVAKVGGVGALLTKPVLIAATVGAVVLAGGGAAVVLRGSTTTAPVAAAPPSSSQPALTTSTTVTAADAEQAVRALLTRLDTDPTGALATAGPSLHALRPATVTAYFGRGTSIQVGTVTAQDGGTVSVELLETPSTGPTTTHQVLFTVTNPAPPTTPSSAAPGAAVTPPSATTGTSAAPTSTSALPSTGSAERALVVDSSQLAALIVAGPSKTPAPTPTRTTLPTSSTSPPSATATTTTAGTTATTPGLTPTTIPSSTPSNSTTTTTP